MTVTFSNEHSGWSLERLDDVCNVNPGRDLEGKDDALIVSKVPMAAIEEGTGRLDPSEHVRLGDVRRKSLTHFQENDVVIAKISPSFENGKVAIATGLANGYGVGTTEIHVLRPHDRLDRRYLLHFLLSLDVRMPLTSSFSGTVGQQRISLEEVKDIHIPVPPLEVQRAVVAEIERALTLVDHAEASAAEVSRKAALLQGSVAHAAHRSVACAQRLQDVADITLGPAFKSGGYVSRGEGRRLLRSANIGSGRIVWDAATVFWPPDDEEVEHLLLRPSDTVLTMKRPIVSDGLKAAIVQEKDCPALLVQGAARIRAHDPSAARWIFEMIRVPGVVEAMLTESGTSTGPPYASAAAIRDARIPWPNASNRRLLLQRLTGTREIVTRSQAGFEHALRRAETLRRSILKAAFEGRLTSRDAQDATSLDDIEQAIAS